MKLLVVSAMMLWATLSVSQTVHVSHAKGGLTLSVSAQKSYDMMASEKKTPVLTVQCAEKGKKTMHMVLFSPGEAIGEDKAEDAPRSGELYLDTTLGGKKDSTPWIPYGDTVTFAYYGRTEPERIQFLRLLLDSPTISFDFTPFLTGTTITSTFDLSQLRQQVTQHPECAMP